MGVHKNMGTPTNIYNWCKCVGIVVEGRKDIHGFNNPDPDQSLEFLPINIL